VKYFVKEPAVDIIIVNWNYESFVADAINSVKDQTYRNFQCIVVDNGSNDNSVERITKAIDNHPQFKLFRLPNNLGHLGGALWGLEHASEEFVIFLDADDVLFPDYLASHLQAHLAAGPSVGFTSSNCVTMNAHGSLLTGGRASMYYFWHHGTPALRPIKRTMRLRVVDDGAYLALARASRYLPAQAGRWCWCPGSSNMFRRILLDRIRPVGLSPALFGGVDSFFLPILHALTGTILIDQPLSAYRLHGNNESSTLPSLHGVLGPNPRATTQKFISYRRMLIWLVDHVDDVVILAGKDRFWEIFARAAATQLDGRQAFSSPEFQEAVAQKYLRLVDLYGEVRVFQELRQRLLFPEYLKIVLAARGRSLSIGELSRGLSREIMRKGRVLYQKILDRFG
jgi:glycosyltransferase involved in cell wall biosynthesis